MRSHPITLRHLKFLPVQCTVEDARQRRLERTSDPRIRDFHIHLRQRDVPGPTSTFVGSCGLTDINPVNYSAEAGILISPDVHRMGLGTEALLLLLNFAFDDLHLHRVVFETGEDNILMRTWFSRILQIEPEAQFKEAWKCEDGWVDAVLYRILEHEWRDTLRERLEQRIRA